MLLTLVQEFVVCFLVISILLRLYGEKHQRWFVAALRAGIVFVIAFLVPLAHGNMLLTIAKCAHSHITVRHALMFVTVQLLAVVAAVLVVRIS